jgi:hypothetical protein
MALRNMRDSSQMVIEVKNVLNIKFVVIKNTIVIGWNIYYYEKDIYA